MLTWGLAAVFSSACTWVKDFAVWMVGVLYHGKKGSAFLAPSSAGFETVTIVNEGMVDHAIPWDIGSLWRKVIPNG